MSVSFFGRTEPDGRRRLGSDLHLIGKWLKAAILAPPRGSYALLQFSSADQEKLLTKPACELRIKRGEDNSIKVEIVEGKRSELDPEVSAMLYNTNYQRCSAKHTDLLNTIEDASPEGDVIEATEYEKAIKEGLDPEAAKTRAQEAFKRHIDKAGRRVWINWRIEKLRRKKRLGERVVFIDGDDPRLAFHDTLANSDVSEAPATNIPAATNNTPEIKKPFERAPGAGRPKRHTPEVDTSSKTTGQERQVTPDAVFPEKLTSDSASFSPAHGSETTELSLSSGSPRSSSDGSSPSLGSTTASVETVVNSRIGTYSNASIDSSNGYSQYLTGETQDAYGHLGSGLTKAFLDGTFVAPPGFYTANHNSLFISNHATAAHDGGVFLNQPVYPYLDRTNFGPQYSTFSQYSPGGGNVMAPQFAPFGGFSPLQPVFEAGAPVRKYPPPPPLPKPPVAPKRARIQPWAGMTCYDIVYQASSDTLVPEYWTTKVDKARYLQHKIHDLTLDDVDLRTDPLYSNAACQPVHIFVDLSNIIIGFYDSLKMKRSIDIRKRVKTPAFSFENFDKILSRGRKSTKRVVAGSLGSSSKRWPEYMVQADGLGYEMNILQRVLKPVSPQLRKKSKGGIRDMESTTSGPETSGDDYFSGTLKNGEQGVDELLHLKILQSAVDAQVPGTIALATGDAAHAEFSDGFKKNIERVLHYGWNIELYGWSRNISSAWRDPAWLARWAKRFRIIELDNYSEELFDISIDSLQQE